MSGGGALSAYPSRFRAMMRILKILFVALAIFSVGEAAQAASLYFSPSSGTYGTDRNFSVSVMVSTDQAMNAASGLINFPTDKLEVISVSKNGSIFNLWVQEPSFSNSGAVGNVSSEGIVLNPGFIGSAGRILNITFQAKSEGAASVKFVNGSVLANDGQGTNILSRLGTGSYTLQRGLEPKPGPQAPPLLPPVITYYPKYHTSPGKRLVIEGTALPDSNIEIRLEGNSDDIIILGARSNEVGTWYVFYDDVMPSGTYKLTARKILEDGTASRESGEVYVKVNSWFYNVWQWVKTIGLPIVLSIILLIVLSLTVAYLWRKILVIYSRIRKESHEAQKAAETGLDKIKSEVLNKEPAEKIVKDIKKIEEEVVKEIKDIEEK